MTPLCDVVKLKRRSNVVSTEKRSICSVVKKTPRNDMRATKDLTLNGPEGVLVFDWAGSALSRVVSGLSVGASLLLPFRSFLGYKNQDKHNLNYL